MAKKRKTKVQKKLADSRHTFQHSFSPEVFEAKPSTMQPQSKQVSVYYPYLIKDLSKTVFLSLIIIFFQIIFFFILKNNLIVIPGVSY